MLSGVGINKDMLQKTKENLLIGVISGVVSGFVVGVVLLYLQINYQETDLENKLLGSDIYNLSVACVILKSPNDDDSKLPMLFYDTQLPKENVGFMILRRNRNYQKEILENILTMSYSNSIIGVSQDNWSEYAKNQQPKDFLVEAAQKIINNIKTYNKKYGKFVDYKCEN